jgi:hypothetical protein
MKFMVIVPIAMFLSALNVNACEIYSKLVPDGSQLTLVGTVDSEGKVFSKANKSFVLGHVEGGEIYTIDSSGPVCRIDGDNCFDLTGSSDTYLVGTKVYAEYGFVAETVNCTPHQALAGAEVLLVHGG